MYGKVQNLERSLKIKTTFTKSLIACRSQGFFRAICPKFSVFWFAVKKYKYYNVYRTIIFLVFSYQRGNDGKF
jgi:hypothetical protein